MNWVLLQNSLLVALSSAAAATLLGIAAALFTAGLHPILRKGLSACGILALALPPFLVTNTWMNYFGLAGTWRPWINFDVYTLKGTVLLISLLYWPLAFLLILSRIPGLEKIYLEQEPALQKFFFVRYLLWPTTRPAIIQSFCLIFVLALNNFAVPTLLQTKVFSEEVWLSFNTKFDYLAALKLSWPLILAPLSFLGWIHFKPVAFQFRTKDFSHSLYAERLGFPLRSIAALLTILVLAISLGLPAYQLLSSPRTWREFWPAIAAGKFATWNSILFAGGSACIIFLLAVLARNHRSLFASWLFYLSPGVLLGIALIWILNRPGLAGIYQSVAVVFLAFGLRYFAIGWSTARVARSFCDPRLSDVLDVFGGSRRQKFLLAEWPQMRATLFAGLYIIFLFCLWEVETLILIVPPGRETLSLRIFNMLHYGHAGQVDGLCVWLLLLALAPLLIFTAAGKVWQLSRASIF